MNGQLNKGLEVWIVFLGLIMYHLFVEESSFLVQ